MNSKQIIDAIARLDGEEREEFWDWIGNGVLRQTNMTVSSMQSLEDLATVIASLIPRRRTINAERDQRIVAACRLGVSQKQLAKEHGLARSTIAMIVKREEERRDRSH